MADNCSKRSSITFAVISGCMIVLFAALAVMFPYTGDDWAWGSSIGMERLQIFFDNYNGRYFGNFLILAVSRSKLLKVVSMVLSYYAACWLCYRYTPVKRNTSLLFALVLFLFMPREIFQQSIVWAAGFSNYVPSALISAAYIILVRNITGEQQPAYSRTLWIVTFLMGFSGGLFIENLTLFNICLGIAVIGWTFLRFKTLYSAHFGFLFGAVIGAAWMFSNSVYSSISVGTDGYRSVPQGLGEMLRSCYENGHHICNYLIFSNPVMCTIAVGLLLVLTVRFVRKSQNQTAVRLAVCAMVVSVICLLAILVQTVQGVHPVLDAVSAVLRIRKFQVALALLFVLSILAVPLICVERGRKFRMLLPLYCVPVSAAPLLVVNPIGPRCVFGSYLLLMMFLVDLFGYITREMEEDSVSDRRMICGFAALAVLLATVYFYIFVPVYHYDTQRNEFAMLQAENGEQEIVVCDLPNTLYLWCSSPATEPWGTRYKLFHGIDTDATLTVLSIPEFEEYYETYLNAR